MRRKIIILLSCICLGLSACGKSEGKTETASARLDLGEYEEVKAYKEDGSEIYMYKDKDNVYRTKEKVAYYRGCDGIYRARGNENLYSEKELIDGKEDEELITEQEALEAIKNYCFEKEPGLERAMADENSKAYFTVSTDENKLINVTYRGYTAVLVNYQIDPVSGDVYATDSIPGIREEAMSTGEEFNIKTYMN